MRADVTAQPVAWDRWLGGLALLCLAIHFIGGASTEQPIELLWCCYASTIVLALSIFVEWRPGISAASVFHIGVGLPTYLLDLLAGGSTGSRTVTAALAHLVAPMVALRMVSRHGLTRHAWLLAAGLFAVTQHLALFTDPALNINLAHASWEPFAGVVDSMFVYRLLNLLGVGALCFIADRGLRAWKG